MCQFLNFRFVPMFDPCCYKFNLQKRHVLDLHHVLFLLKLERYC
jgi:hypothetical protein